ncbi:MAG: hypothetical protein Q4F49_08390 [Pseudoxanthomonas suwonensis]|nr:hypothetical protein [Pseudoxanthomonas suwonensis]
MLIASRLLGGLCGLALLLPLAAPVQAQTAPPQPLDFSSLLANAQDLLLRMPDAQADGLFQALHAVSRQEQDRAALCRVLEPDGDRSLQGMSALAGRLSPESREVLANAIAEAVVIAMQNSTPAAWDRDAAEQALRANAVRAGLLHEGFSEGLVEGASSQARCQSLAWMLDVIAERPVEERVLLTRLLLAQGLAQLG